MSEHNITIESGKSLKLKTAGKYCDRDIVVTASGSSGGEEKSKLAQYAEGTLTEITANDLKGATTICDKAFYSSSIITGIEIPDGVTSIGKQAFGYCKKLTTIKLPNTLTTIREKAFSESAITTLKIPDSVTNTFNYYAYRCPNLVEFDSGSGLKYLNMGALSDCTALTKVTLRENIVGIMESAIGYCSALTSITIPSKVNEIRRTGLVIGSSKNKATITFLGTTPPTITTDVFYNGYLEKIIVPKGCGDVYKSATNWSNFADYIEEATE